MSLLGPNNALAWAHFRLRGGWARSVSVTVGAVVLIAAVIVTMHRLNADSPRRILFGWTTALLALQGACLVLYIPGRIGTVIRGDLQSKMIESHRLMPLPPGHAVAGYILGAATQPLVFCAGIFFLGALVAGAAGVHLPRWAFANGVLLVFAAFVWVVCAYTSLGGRVGGGILAASIMIPYLSQGFVLALLPGMTVLLSPVMGQSVFDLRNAGTTLPATYAIAFAAQFFFATLCFIGAARAYRSSVEVSLDTVLACGFLLGWVAVSCAALRAWDDFRPRGWNPGTVETPVQVAASLIAALLIAVAPVAANALQRTQWRRHVATRDPYPMRRPPRLAVVLAVAVLAMLAIPFAPTDLAIANGGVLLRTAAVLAITLIGLYFFFDWTYTLVPRAGFAAVLWIGLTWGGPMALQWVHYALTTGWNGRYAPTPDLDLIAGFTTASPIGTLIALWTRDDINTTAGIGVQILVALVPMCLWLTASRRRRTAAAHGMPARR